MPEHVYEFCPFVLQTGERCVLGNHGEGRHEVHPYSSASVQAMVRQENLDARLAGPRQIPEGLSTEYVRPSAPGQVFRRAVPDAPVVLPAEVSEHDRAEGAPDGREAESGHAEGPADQREGSKAGPEAQQLLEASAEASAEEGR